MAVQKNIGDTLVVNLSFKYVGPEYSGYKVRVAIGNKGITFDEILFNQSPAMQVPKTDVPTVYGVPHQYTDILITDAISAGFYEIYAKLFGIPGADQFWYGQLDDIQILSPQGQFSELTVTYT